MAKKTPSPTDRRQPPTTAPTAAPTSVCEPDPVRRGPGRPAKPTQLDGDPGAAWLMPELLQAELDRCATTAAFRDAPTIANKCTLLEAELRCAQACAARCRAEGNYTHALKFGELCCKLAQQHATAKDQLMADELKALELKVLREREAARGAH